MPTARRSRTSPPKAGEGATAGAVRVLKKYPNRRLYDTQTSSYITLADVKQMVLDGQDFEVRDAKSSDDLTRSILLQIILEEESAGEPMFSTQALEQIIRFYGHAMQGVMGNFLEQNLQTFTDAQTRFTQQAQGAYDPKNFTPEAWTKLLGGQTPMAQGLMGNYLEQSKNLFEQMQAQAAKQAEALFPGLKPTKK